MPKKTGAIILILLTLTLGFTMLMALSNNTSYPPLAQPGAATPKQIQGAPTGNLTNSLVLRNISINNFGIAKVTDTFTVRNDGVNYATIADIFYPESEWDNLITYSAWFGNTPLNTDEITSGGYDGIRIHFHKSLAPGENYTFTLVQYFDGTLTTVKDESLGNVNRFDFLACPFSPYKTEVCNGSVTLPRDAQTHSPLSYSLNSIEPFNSSYIQPEINFWFTGGSSIIQLKTVYRQITVDPWVGVKVVESHLIENKGASSLSKIYLSVPPGTVKFEAYDVAGLLSFWPSGDSVAITTRYPIPPNSTYVYYTVYTIPITMRQVGSSGSYLFTFNVLPEYGGLIEHFCVSLIFNNFAYVSFHYPPTLTLSPSAKTVLFYAWNNVAPTQSVFTYVAYGVGFPGTYLRPFVLMLLFGTVATVYVIIRSRRVELLLLVERPVEAAASVLREFCDLYEEKNALILEMDRLREDALRKKIKKAEYSRRVKAAERELALLNKQIERKKTELLELNKKFESDIKSLEISEADREQAKLALQHLRRRYLLKRLSKETYLKLREAQEKKLKKAESNIDKKIQDLRREAI
nr:hypothetical protein [Candidatus Sigynarchaeota archaeon]